MEKEIEITKHLVICDVGFSSEETEHLVTMQTSEVFRK